MEEASSLTLGRLSNALRALIAAAEANDWERIEGLSLELLTLQQTATAIAPPPSGAASYREQLKETLALYERALTLCRDRKTVIEPLVRALAPPPPSTPPST